MKTKEKKSLREKLMERVSDLVYNHYRVVLVLVVVLSVFSYFSYRGLELKLNFIDMLAENDPAVVHYREAVEQFGALSFLFIVVEAQDIERSKEYADALAEKLLENPEYVTRVFHKVEIRDYLGDALLFLDKADLEVLAHMVESNREPLADMAATPGLLSLVGGVNGLLAGYTRTGRAPDFSEDADFDLVFDSMISLVRGFREYGLSGPGEESQRLRRKMTAGFITGGEDLPLDPSEPYLVSKDGKRLLMLVSSTQPAENFEWCSEFMEYVEGQAASLKDEFPEVPDPKMTGNAAIMRDDNRVIRHDMKVTTTVAFCGIMLLFAFSFRNLSSILMVGVPLAVGILWSLGGAYWAVGHLTPVTAIFGAILLGLGIDYAILILSRYTEERHSGRSIKESLDITMTTTGVSIITGAMATALAFFSLTQATFRGGQEMGLIAGIGIILFVVMMTFGLGALLVVRDRARESLGPTQHRFNPRIMRLLARAVDGSAVYILAVLTAGLVVMAWIAPRYEFEYNYLNLEPQNVESIKLVHKIPEWFGIDTNYGMVVSHSIKEDRKLAAELRAQPTVSKVDAISDYIPEDQDEKLKIIGRMREVVSKIEPGEADMKPSDELDSIPPMPRDEFERLMEALRELRDTVGAPGRGLVGLFYLADMEDAELGARELLAELDELIKAFEAADKEKLRKNLGRLDHEVSRGLVRAWEWFDRMTRADRITIQSISKEHPELIDRFQGKSGDFLVYAYPSLVIWEEQNLKAVAADLRKVDPDAMGVAVLFDRILDQLKSDLVRIAALALGVVFVVIFLNYRSLWHTALTLVPLVAGAAAMVGAMNLIGLKFNIVNTGMLPLVIGIGVDYGVYVVHRYITEGKGEGSIRPVVESTGRAVTLSALTTMIGFSSIMLAQWRGLALMGGTLTMGIAFCWIGAVVYLSSGLKTVEIIKARMKKDQG